MPHSPAQLDTVFSALNRATHIGVTEVPSKDQARLFGQQLDTLVVGRSYRLETPGKTSGFQIEGFCDLKRRDQLTFRRGRFAGLVDKGRVPIFLGEADETPGMQWYFAVGPVADQPDRSADEPVGEPIEIDLGSITRSPPVRSGRPHLFLV